MSDEEQVTIMGWDWYGCNYKQDFQEAMAKADLDNLAEAVVDINHENNLRRNLALARLMKAGERSISDLVDVVRKRDIDRLATAIELLDTIYSTTNALHPDFGQLLFDIARSNLPIHICRSSTDILAHVAREKFTLEIHEYFIELFFGDDKLLQDYAINYLVWSKSVSSVPLLALLLNDDDYELAKTAAKSLKKLERADATYMLKQWEKGKSG